MTANQDQILSALAHTGHRISQASAVAVYTDGEMRAGRIREVRLAVERANELLRQFDALPAVNLGEAA